MRRSFLVAFIPVVLSCAPTSADQVRQDCKVLLDPASEAPHSLRDYVKRFEPSALRVCRRSDQQVETYYALSAIVHNSNGICHFYDEEIVPKVQHTKYKQQYMLRTFGGCPQQNSSRYVPADHVSEADFIEIMYLINRISTSSVDREKIFSTLPDEQRRSKGFKSFHTHIGTAKSPHVVRISRMSNFMNLFSTFDVLIEKPDNAYEWYVLRIRKFFGLTLVDFDIAVL